jgi:hypothetical protein
MKFSAKELRLMGNKEIKSFSSREMFRPYGPHPVVGIESAARLTPEDLSDEFRNNVDVMLLSEFAGAGHNRVCSDIAISLGDYDQGGPLREIYQIGGSLADKAHSLGSNNWFAKSLTEFIQQHQILQQLWAGPFRLAQLRFDGDVVYQAAKDFLSRSSKQKVVMIAFHPDIAFHLGLHKERLERESGKSICVVIVMTDHLSDRSQFNWLETRANLIVFPEDSSSRKGQEQLYKWTTILRRSEHADVATSPYAINPVLATQLSPENMLRRQEQLLPGGSDPVKTLILMGGSAPGQGYLMKLKLALPSQFETHVVIKSSPQTAYFESEMRRMGAIIHSAADTNQFLSLIPALFTELVPSLVLTKPSEQTVLLHATPDQLGGAVIGLLPAVGDQEIQNVNFVRGHRVLPLKYQQEQMYLSSIEELKSFYRDALGWRGIELPNSTFDERKDAIAAGIFLLKLKESGILFAMSQYKKDEAAHSLSTDGGLNFWRIIYRYVTDGTYDSSLREFLDRRKSIS